MGEVHFSMTFDLYREFTTVGRELRFSDAESALSTYGSCPRCEEETRNADLCYTTDFIWCSPYAS